MRSRESFGSAASGRSRSPLVTGRARVSGRRRRRTHRVLASGSGSCPRNSSSGCTWPPPTLRRSGSPWSCGSGSRSCYGSASACSGSFFLRATGSRTSSCGASRRAFTTPLCPAPSRCNCNSAWFAGGCWAIRWRVSSRGNWPPYASGGYWASGNGSSAHSGTGASRSATNSRSCSHGSTN